MMKNVRHQRRLALLAGLLLTMAAVPFTAFSLPGPGPGSDDMCDFINIYGGGNGEVGRHVTCYLPETGQSPYRDLKTGKTILVETTYKGCNPCDQWVYGRIGEENQCALPIQN